MQSISEHDLTYWLLAIATIVALGRGAGDLARRLNQPEILGQLLVGVLLGPSVFGALVPSVYDAVFLNHDIGVSLSVFSWAGAILLLLAAGIEVDLGILRKVAKPGAIAAAFAIIPSLVVGTLFARMIFGEQNGYVLGIVLSVTGVGVVAKILIERETMRRDYAQVILAAGIASEILAWLLISIVASLSESSPLIAGMRSALFAIGFFLFMVFVGKRFVAWAMRGVADVAPLVNGQLSLVLVLTFLSAAFTQALGLHALLGAFVFGVLLTESPRARMSLLESIQTLLAAFFGPIFFVLAGTRVDIFELGEPSAALSIVQLLVVATLVKVGLGMMGARLGGIPGWQAATVGVGVNMKGGTDVVVAILGTELGLLSTRAYTVYAIVAVLTVLVSPPLLAWLEQKGAPTEEEQARLEREEAEHRSYFPSVERVLVPVIPQLLPTLAASTVQSMAGAKQGQGEVMDIVEVQVDHGGEPEHAGAAAESDDRLRHAADLDRVTLKEQRVHEPDPLRAVLAAERKDNLIAIGARPPQRSPLLSFGQLQDSIVQSAKADVLVAIDHEAEHFDCSEVQRILVPVNGMDYSLASGDVAGYLGAACDAEIVVMTVVHARLGSIFWREQDHRALREAGQNIVDELIFRLSRLGVRCTGRVVVGEDPGSEILAELGSEQYQLVVLGGINRGAHGGLFLGNTVQTVLTEQRTPAVLLVTRRTPETAASTAG